MSVRRHSPLLDYYADEGAARGAHNDMDIAVGGVSLSSDSYAIADISALKKNLVVGRGAERYLQPLLARVPTQLFECVPNGRAQAVRIHHRQFVLIADDKQAPGESWPEPDETAAEELLVLPYECAEMVLLGAMLESLLQELSTRDPQALAAGRWYTMRLAHAEVGLRIITDPAPHWRVTCSPADAVYLFSVLADICREHHGDVTTIDAYLNYLA